MGIDYEDIPKVGFLIAIGIIIFMIGAMAGIEQVKMNFKNGQCQIISNELYCK